MDSLWKIIFVVFLIIIKCFNWFVLSLIVIFVNLLLLIYFDDVIKNKGCCYLMLMVFL